MTIEQQAEAIRLIQDDFYSIEIQNNRRAEREADDVNQVLALWRSCPFPLHYWQIARIVNIPDEEVALILLQADINYETRETENCQLFRKLSSPYMLFDGAGLIREYAEKKNITLSDLAATCQIGKRKILGIAGGYLLPTRDELIALIRALDIDIEIAKLLSYDVYQILHFALPLGYTDQDIYKARNNTVKYKKTLLIRHTLAFWRVARGYSIGDMAKIIGSHEYTYLQYELGIQAPPVEDMQKIQLALGVENIADMYAVECMPINYLYIVNKQVKRHERLVFLRRRVLYGMVYRGGADQHMRNAFETQSKKAEQLAIYLKTGGQKNEQAAKRLLGSKEQTVQ
jgi:transcriptional regulator with XRE-family HTH domain